MKIGVADYGMDVWEGGSFDWEDRLQAVKGIGFAGIECLPAVSPGEAMNKAAKARALGMDFATVRAPSQEMSIQWTAAFGKTYMPVFSGEKMPLETFYRQVNIFVKACSRSGVRAAIHNHMGQMVETQEDLEALLRSCPDCRLILDTAHLAAIGGDPVDIVKKYADRLESLHLKDWIKNAPEPEVRYRGGRFCGLGEGNIGLDNALVLHEAMNRNFDGWVFVEHDHHLRDPLLDLEMSREYLRKHGY